MGNLATHLIQFLHTKITSKVGFYFIYFLLAGLKLCVQSAKFLAKCAILSKLPSLLNVTFIHFAKKKFHVKSVCMCKSLCVF